MWKACENRVSSWLGKDYGSDRNVAGCPNQPGHNLPGGGGLPVLLNPVATSILAAGLKLNAY